MLLHTGAAAHPSANGLLTTSAAQINTQAAYALEGSVFIGSAVVQWLRDGLQAIKAASEVQAWPKRARFRRRDVRARLHRPRAPYWNSAPAAPSWA